PAIGLSGHHGERLLAHGRNPHRRPRTLDGGRTPERAGQVAESSTTIDGTVLPERTYHVDGFPDPGHALGTRRIRNAVTLPDLPGRLVIGADAEPQIEPPIRQMIDGGRTLGQPRRMVRRWIDRVGHRGADAHAPRLRGEGAQHRPPVAGPRPEPVAVYDTIVAERLGGRPVVL